MGSHLRALAVLVLQAGLLLVATAGLEEEAGSEGRQRRAIFASEMFVSENQRPPFPRRIGTVGRISAGDEDARFALSGPGADEEPKNLFVIDPRTGEVFVTGSLDREEESSYQLSVTALNELDNRVELPVPLDVFVIDQNDNRPEFLHEPYVGRLYEHAPRGSPVMHVTATDADDPDTDNGVLHYRLEVAPSDPEPALSFDIDPYSGTIVTASDPALIDHEVLKERHFEVVVYVSDMAETEAGLSSSVTATIILQDVNDFPPIFEKTEIDLTIAENFHGSLLNLSVTDGDVEGGPNWRAVYSIVSGDPDGRFNITTDPITNRAHLTVTEPLDFEQADSYTLVLRVDNEEPVVPEALAAATASEATVTVRLVDQNEAPSFSALAARLEWPENVAEGTLLLDLHATDPDIRQLQRVRSRMLSRAVALDSGVLEWTTAMHNRFSILSDPANWLRVDSVSGEVRTAAKLDRESSFVQDGRYYTASFLATDDGNPPATGTSTLVITLVDVNDNAPMVTPLQGRVCEGVRGVAVALLRASDRDAGTNGGPFSFVLRGASAAAWKLEGANGTHAQLVLTRPLPLGLHRVQLRVTDSGVPPQNADVAFQASVCSCPQGSEPDCSAAGSPLMLLLAAPGGCGLLAALLIAAASTLLAFL
ncbi:unnamed protein product [Lampetra fluviatilis]